MKKSNIKEKLNEIIKKLKNLAKYDNLNYVWVGFFLFAFLLVINVVIMTLYLVDSEDEYKYLDNAYVNAVLPGQEIEQTLDLGIVHIEKVNFSKLEIGDKIVISGDFQLDVYWVETIISIDDNTLEISATYDDITTNTFNSDDIVGTFTSEANFIGTIYYSASFTKGFTLLAFSHVFLLWGYYHIFLTKKESKI